MCWPVVIYACLPFLKNLDAIYYFLLGAGTFLWLFSCVAVSMLLLMVVGERWAANLTEILVGWLFGWPLLLIAGVWLESLIEHPDWLEPYLSWLHFYLIIPGTILWLLSCYGLYDTLFTMLEARWPATKGIREIVSSLLRMLFRHHH